MKIIGITFGHISNGFGASSVTCCCWRYWYPLEHQPLGKMYRYVIFYRYVLKKILMILWILRPFFHMLAVNVCRQSMCRWECWYRFWFLWHLAVFFWSPRLCWDRNESRTSEDPKKKRRRVYSWSMSQVFWSPCVAQTFQDISITGSFPCRVCGHSIPGRDHHCVGALGRIECRKFLNGMG